MNCDYTEREIATLFRTATFHITHKGANVQPGDYVELPATVSQLQAFLDACRSAGYGAHNMQAVAHDDYWCPFIREDYSEDVVEALAKGSFDTKRFKTESGTVDALSAPGIPFHFTNEGERLDIIFNGNMLVDKCTHSAPHHDLSAAYIILNADHEIRLTSVIDDLEHNGLSHRISPRRLTCPQFTREASIPVAGNYTYKTLLEPAVKLDRQYAAQAVEYDDEAF